MSSRGGGGGWSAGWMSLGPRRFYFCLLRSRDVVGFHCLEGKSGAHEISVQRRVASKLTH